MLAALVVASFLASTPLEETPVPIKFAVTTGAREALLSGDVAVMPSRPANIERKAARGPERQSLFLDVKTLDDGRLLVRAVWSDATSEGEQVKWEPSFVIKRHSDAEVRLEFPGGTRVLKLTAG